MLTNQRGNALLTVLITSLVMVTIGMAIMSSTIGGAKRTEVRETDIDITYEGLKAVEEISAKLVFQLQPTKQLEINQLTPVNINSKVRDFIQTEILPSYQSSDTIKCITVVDVSGTQASNLLGAHCGKANTLQYHTFGLDFIDTNLTRVYEIIVNTENPDSEEGKVEKIVRKRIILSPIPSFLKYTLGSREQLQLNGSPHLVGNVYAHSLGISEDANYQLSNLDDKKVSAPFPSIVGDLYTSYDKVNYDHLKSLVDTRQFYPHLPTPDIKQDSQFTDISFDQTYSEEVGKVLDSLGLSLDQALTKANIRNTITANYLSNSPIFFPLVNGILSENVQGTVKADQSITVKGLRHPGVDLIVQGNVNILANSTMDIGNIISTGNVTISNATGEMSIGNIVAAGKVSIEANAPVTLKENIVSFDDVLFQSQNSTSSIEGNIYSGGNLTIKGDANDPDDENDEIEFDSVIYAKGKTSISNLNITGKSSPGHSDQRGQLILLSKGELLVTRMNEFQYYTDEEEKREADLLPDASENIKPLQAFLYTESNATLYGVGSLFYVNGGVFSKGNLTVNAVRGDVDSMDTIQRDLFSNQEKKLSRFIVHYNKDVLLSKLDDLPKVDSLSLISDEIIVE
ncbi:polymer-forming cytoskeletal protein [Rossellomorea vietnamensis]|uniref:polymer-forming cytoskeletal protein n=1 Tax=Rossellomorea vietnamensis TaxID=218284 RepID=UPI003090DE48|nr:polymer-forming cytoskeletal protein [Rossellomorea vietnamensis]WQI95621.1 polymer-forming cytoskeletal protein [Rossellomorea vietnamensis]